MYGSSYVYIQITWYNYVLGQLKQCSSGCMWLKDMYVHMHTHSLKTS